MTLESLTIISRYLGDGVQTAFPVGFPVFGDGRHVRAVISTGTGSTLEERELAYGIDYSVAEVSGGGECVTADPVPAGHTLTLCLDLPYVQPRDFDNQGRLDAEEIEKGLDYVTALAMQNAAAIERAVKLPVGDAQSPEELVADLFAARGEVSACRDAACECAMRARAAQDEAGAHAGRAEEARDEAERFASQAAIQTIPAATETIRGGIRTGDGLVITDTDTLHVAMPLPQPGAGDEGKVLAVAAGSAGWQTPEVGASDLAALTQTAANMLPRSEYAADAPMRVYAHARITGAGEILHAHGIAGSVRVSAGNYQILLTRQLVNMTVICGLAGGTGTASFMGASGLVVDIRTWNNSYAAADGAFFVIICAGGVM